MSETNEEYHVDTNEVLKELQAEGFDVAGKEPEVPSQQEPKQETAEEPKQEPEVKEDDNRVIDRQPKEPTLVPAWKVKIAQEKLQKENEELKAKILNFQKTPTKENERATRETVANIRELASEAGLELDERQEMFFERIAETIASRAKPADDVLKTLEALQQQHQVNALEAEFDAEFSKELLPKIKEQYGDMPERELTTLRSKLHELAFSEQYAKVPLTKIFRAEADDLGIQPAKQSMRAPKSGKTRGTDIDFSQMDEASFSQMSDEQIDAYVASHGGNPWQNTRR